MAELTDAARRCLDAYLAEVRSSLRHCPSVDVADVERDVAEPIEHALAEVPMTVDATELRDVLRGLGSPSQWVPQEELGRFQRALLALRSGPEDLRLGYLALGVLAGTLLAAACLNLMLGFVGMLPFLLLGLVANFLLARAALSTVSEPTQAEGWLIYPSLFTIYIPITTVMLLWPIAVAILAEILLADPGTPPKVLPWARSYSIGIPAAVVALTLGPLWWASLSFVACRWPAAVRVCYAPFAEGFRPGRRLLTFGFACLLVSLAFLAVVASASLRQP